MKSYIIHFIRHGITEANLKGQYAGSTDFTVCEQGIKELDELKRNYQYPKVEAYYSSPLTRCRQTCGIIYPGITPIIVKDLSECNFGDWEGKSYLEMQNNNEFKQWLKSGQTKKAPNGESGEEFSQRINNAFEEIVKNLMKEGIMSAAIFSHGGVIMNLLRSYGIPNANPYDLMVANGCGYSVRIDIGMWMRDKVFEIFDRVPLGYEGKISGKFKEMIDDQKNAVENQTSNV